MIMAQINIGSMVYPWTFTPHTGTIDSDLDRALYTKLEKHADITPKSFGVNRKGEWNFRECFWNVDWTIPIKGALGWLVS